MAMMRAYSWGLVPTITIMENTGYNKLAVLLNTVSLSPCQSQSLTVPVRKLMEYLTV